MADNDLSELLPAVLVGLVAFGLGALIFQKLRKPAEKPQTAAPYVPALPPIYQRTTPFKPTQVTSGKTGGILLAAIQAGTAQSINWVTIDVDGMKVDVASDAMKAAIPDGSIIRLPMSYAENIAAAKIMAAQGVDVIVPNQAIADAIYAQSAKGALLQGYGSNASEQAVMDSIDTSKKFEVQINNQFAGKTGLLAGPWKYWCLDRDIDTNLGAGYPPAPRAVNYGSWKKDGHPYQTLGRKHDQISQKDYSQLFQPIRRYAKDSSGKRIDLLDWMEKKGVSARSTSEFRNTSNAVA